MTIKNTNHPLPSQAPSEGIGDEVWEKTFHDLFTRAVDTFESGVRDPDQMFSEEERAFLDSIGATSYEIFDYVEDWSEDGEPTPEIVREVTGLRREYFLQVQKGKSESSGLDSDSLPSPYASMGGHRWLPRIIEKARAKLRGELPPDIMYGCGMDRPFLQKRNIQLPEFLKVVWEAGEHDEKILHFVDQRVNGTDPT